MDEQALQPQQIQEALKQLKASLFKDIRLPSGLSVKMKKPSIVDLAASGGIPESVYGLIAAGAAGKKEVDIDPKQIPSLAETLNAVAYAALKDGGIYHDLTDANGDVIHADILIPVTEDDPNGFSVKSDLTFEDKQFIFAWANEETQQLDRFPKGKRKRN